MTQNQFVAFASGDLGFASPTASDGLQLVLGGEYRVESMNFGPDQGFQSGDGAGQGGPIAPVIGDITVGELFSELKVPIVQDRPMAKSLSVELGYRNSAYNTGVTTDTYKIAGEWSPTDSFMIRGGYNRAVRNGNLVELFQPASLGLWSEGGDPCAGATPTLTEPQCALTGVPTGSYGSVPESPAGQYNGIFGGNVDLNPEKSNSYSVGAVFTPEEFMPGFTFSIDYSTIEVKGAIGIVEPNTIITQCALTGDSTLCGLIQRSPTNGNLWVGSNNFVTSTNVNIGFFEVSSIDVAAAYTRSIGNYGDLAFSLRGTWIEKWDQQELPGGPIDDCVGLWGGTCSRPAPEWKHILSTLWNTPWDMSIQATWRMVGGVDEFSTNPAAFNAGAEHYFDLAASYTASFFGETQLTFGVSNVLDNDPPVNGRFGNVAVYGNGNTIGGTWDALGRYIFINIGQSF
jgi:outer membrane receptor protein involved in Fe transport